MNHRLITLFLLVALICSFAPVSTYAASDVQVVIDGQTQSYDQPPVIVNGRTLVPLRAIFEKLGAEVRWFGDTRTVTATRGTTSVILQIGSRQAYKNGASVTLDVEAQLIHSNTMVPLRFVSEALGAEVTWDGTTRTVYIASHLPASIQELTTRQIVSRSDRKIVRVQSANGSGSGIVIREGLVLTNYHLVEGANWATVKTGVGNSYRVEGLAAYDVDHDLAVLKTDRFLGILPVTIGTPSDSHKGDKVIAIGNPVGAQNTVTEGIIANFPTLGGTNLIQVSPPSTVGASGGALFNTQGEVIGVTTSLYVEEGDDPQYAVSIDYIRPWLEDLLTQPLGSIEAHFPQAPLSDDKERQVQNLLTYHYGSLRTSKLTLHLNDWELHQLPDGSVELATTIKAYQYTDYLKHYGDIRQQMIEWGSRLGRDLKAKLPEHSFRVHLYYEDTFNTKPLNFQTEEITEHGSTYTVVHPILLVKKTNDVHVDAQE
ncbi:MAG TPA: stalk domain-containing protein [Bacilli bacterium]|nr:stalk domain-containing protein [Bacilli bacterium]